MRHFSFVVRLYRLTSCACDTVHVVVHGAAAGFSLACACDGNILNVMGLLFISFCLSSKLFYVPG